MRPLALGAFAFLATSLVSSAAFAGWQYAEWNMTPDQVISASNGKARKASKQDLEKQKSDRRKYIADGLSISTNPEEWTLGLAYSEFYIGDMRNEVEFYFRHEKLTHIVVDPDNCHNVMSDYLKRLLIVKYGEPVYIDNDELSNDTVWRDISSKSMVTLRIFLDEVVKDECTITYEPISEL